ncbi:MAG: 50S ribosomal protein L32e [Methanomassiliicoccales archaeon]|nr:50S ribosomal protein L32e [Methanomassiliicoccales archaeon]
MSPAKKEIKEIADLPYYKEEHAEVLKSMGIETLDQLYDALSDEDRFEEIIAGKKLKGVGEKHAEHWLELIEDSRIEKEAEAPAGETQEEAVEAEEKVEIVEEPEEPKAKKLKVEEKKKKKEEVEVVEPEAEVVPEKGYMAKLKPELDAVTKDLLAKRAEIDSRRPAFKRQEWFRFQRLGETWRKPRGIHSKMRRHYGYRAPIVSIGYRGPKDVRDYHPSGFREVMVHTVVQLDAVDPKKEAVRVGGTVGYKKRLAIEKRADELGIRILNRTG